MFIASRQSTMKTLTSTSQFLFFRSTEIMMTHKELARSVILSYPMSSFDLYFPYIRKAPFALSICYRWQGSSIISEKLNFLSLMCLLMESPYDQYFYAKGIPTWACTELGTSRMQGCILSSGVIAFECICRRIRAIGSTYYSYTKIGAKWLLSPDYSSGDSTFPESNMGRKNPFRRASLMTALISSSGAMNMTVASIPSLLRASDTSSRSLVHPSQLPSPKARQ
jgi:hypothetical protein